MKAHEEEHLAEECGYRSVICDHCELEVFAKDLNDHETYCKTRTEYCDRCRSYINVQDFDNHDCVSYEETRTAKDTKNTETGSNGAAGVNRDTIDSAEGFGDVTDDLETRLLLDLQLQELQRERDREARVNRDGPVPSLSSGDTSNESASMGETDNLEADCPNCGRKVLMSDVHNHLLECTEGSNEVKSRDLTGGIGNGFPTAATDDDFDGDIVCEICGCAVAIEVYSTHFQNCSTRYDDPFGYRRNKNRANANLGNGKNGDDGNQKPNETTSKSKTAHLEADCPNCGRKVLMLDVHNHLLECTEGSNEVKNRDLTGGIGNDFPTAATDDDFDGDMVCEICGCAVAIEVYSTHFQNCSTRYDDPFGYRRNKNRANANLGNGKNGDDGNRKPTQETGGAETKNTIPCEFCYQNIEFEKYEDHMSMCPGETGGAGASSGLALLANDLNDNENFLPHAATSLDGAHVNSSNESDFLLPCEFCSKLFATEIFDDHQVACRLADVTNFSTEAVNPRVAENSFDSPPESPVSRNVFNSDMQRAFIEKPGNSRGFAGNVETRVEGNLDNWRSTRLSANHLTNPYESMPQGRGNADFNGKHPRFSDSRDYEWKPRYPDHQNNLSPLPKRVSGYQDMSRSDYNPRQDIVYRSDHRGTISDNANRKVYDPTRRSNVDKIVSETLSNGGHSRRSVFERLGEPNKMQNGGDSMNIRGSTGGSYRSSGYTQSNGAHRTGPYQSPVGNSGMQPSTRRVHKPSARTNATNSDRTNYRRSNDKQ